MLCTAHLVHCALHCPSWALCVCTALMGHCSFLPLLGPVLCTFHWGSSPHFKSDPFQLRKLFSVLSTTFCPCVGRHVTIFSRLVLSNISAQKEQMLAEKQSFFLSRICFSELQEKQSEKQKTFSSHRFAHEPSSPFFTPVCHPGSFGGFTWPKPLARPLYLLFFT